jgi:hypothetical protein
MSTRSSAVPLLVLLPTLIACSAGPDGPAAPGTPAAADAPAATRAPTEAWGCDEPQPGHPTAAEQEAFVAEVARLATTAEQRHGVPAAALVAMAILESGYGWTRLGLETNNLLGWHYVAGPAAGGRDYWVLDCPSEREGAGNRFVVFADRAEAVDFVARQLATSDNYRADTERYRRDRATGADVVAAVDRWVEGIADPYSSRPEEWARTVRRLMNDPYAPSDRRSPERNLYRLSGLTAPPSS